MSKKIKESVAIVLKNKHGEYLAVKRGGEDTFGGMWGLPAASIRGDESHEDAARRAARDKLGVEVDIVSVVGERTEVKDGYDQRLVEFEVVIVSGELGLERRDATVSLYDEMKFTADPTLLVPAAKHGSICSRIYLRSVGKTWG